MGEWTRRGIEGGDGELMVEQDYEYRSGQVACACVCVCACVRACVCVSVCVRALVCIRTRVRVHACVGWVHEWVRQQSCYVSTRARAPRERKQKMHTKLIDLGQALRDHVAQHGQAFLPRHLKTKQAVIG